LIVFTKAWEKYNHLISVDQVITVTGKVDFKNGEPQVKVDHIELVTLDPDDDTWEEPSSPVLEVIEEYSMPNDEYDDDAAEIRTSAREYEVHEPHEIKSHQPFSGESDQISDAFKPGMDEPHYYYPSESMGEHADVILVEKEDDALTIPTYLTSTLILSGALAENNQPRMLRVVLKSNGEKERDCRRLRCVYGALRSSPGSDHFSFLVYERNHHYLIEFPNDTTGISDDLVKQLSELVGVENVIIEPVQSI
jgi:DNA polymerase-3 subunit alpha